tara:strand:- start:121 stop:495 length:375 start_codon:yes stop_codon:yes gene_type:complete
MKKNNISEPKEVAKYIADLMLNKKANDIKLLDISKVTSMSDIIVICSSDSDPKTKAIFDHVIKELRHIGIRPMHTEGQNTLSWVLIDFIDIIVMIFSNESRKYYQIERLWADGTEIAFQKNAND